MGAATESEMKEKKARVEDALHATRAAVEEGILPGGGVALLRASSQCKPDGLSHDQEVGYNIVKRSCKAPLTWIANNAGQDGGIVCEKVLDGKGNFGYNAASDMYEDLVKAGIIDPTKVTRTALQNASSVAILLLTSDALIAEKPKEGKKGGGHGGDRRHVLSDARRVGRARPGERRPTSFGVGLFSFYIRPAGLAPCKTGGFVFGSISRSGADRRPKQSSLSAKSSTCNASRRR